MSDSVNLKRAKVVDSLFRDYAGPAFSIRLWDGWQWTRSPGEKPTFTLVVETPTALALLTARPNEITLGEAFVDRELEIEGDILSVFPVAEHLLNRPRGWRQGLIELFSRTVSNTGRWRKLGSEHSMRRDHSSISYHYDQPIEFFKPWLGRSLAYSCAYFRNANDALDVAQTQKLDLICQKLRMQPLERFLDIGCGWGSLILHAATRYGVRAQGITLSRIQANVAKRRIRAAGLESRCDAELRDYRECEHVSESFDKIASVGMFEHVGLKNLAQYFGIAYRLLKPSGTFLNVGIARSQLSPVRKDSFIDRYVFPDGRLVTLSQAIHAAESVGLEVRDVENLREHYELTLRRWVTGLRENATTLLRYVPEATYRIWLLYMAGSAAAFRRGDIGLYQVLLSRPDRGKSRLPLIREDWYSQNPRNLGLEH